MSNSKEKYEIDESQRNVIYVRKRRGILAAIEAMQIPIRMNGYELVVKYDDEEIYFLPVIIGKRRLFESDKHLKHLTDDDRQYMLEAADERKGDILDFTYGYDCDIVDDQDDIETVYGDDNKIKLDGKRRSYENRIKLRRELYELAEYNRIEKRKVENQNFFDEGQSALQHMRGMLVKADRAQEIASYNFQNKLIDTKIKRYISDISNRKVLHRRLIINTLNSISSNYPNGHQSVHRFISNSSYLNRRRSNDSTSTDQNISRPRLQ